MLTLSKIQPDYPYTLKNDPDVTFTLKPLNELELEQVNFQMMDYLQNRKKGAFIFPPLAVQLLLEFGVMSWRGIKNEQGDNDDYAPEKLVRLPSKIRREVAEVIYLVNRLSESEKKSSSLPTRS